jgi:hypothetical protein
MKMTYSEQLRHPNWQRMRLKVFEKAGFKCQICGDDETTLNVHHKQYIKGRMAWEYDITNFDALCENCHESTHESKARIMDVLACVPSVRWAEIADLLLGWANGYPGVDKIDMQCPHAFRIGILANELECALNVHSSEALIGQLQDWDRTTLLEVEIKPIPNRFVGLDTEFPSTSEIKNGG